MFGHYIRALRLGFRELPNGGGFLRISRYKDGCIAELLPMEGPVKNQAKTDYHVVWWEDGEQGIGFINSSPVLKAITRVRKPFIIELDYDGKLVTS
jgi:hypothetical protein